MSDEEGNDDRELKLRDNNDTFEGDDGVAAWGGFDWEGDAKKDELDAEKEDECFNVERKETVGFFVGELTGDVSFWHVLSGFFLEEVVLLAVVLLLLLPRRTGLAGKAAFNSSRLICQIFFGFDDGVAL